MRIIAGRLGGRLFDSPGTHRTHPMSDRIRGGLFAVLGNIDNLTVLDAFAGSGALSFEALSRGAAHAVAIDQDRMAQKTIRHNSQALALNGQLQLIAASAGAWLRTTTDMFDLVLCDPPFDDVQPQLLERLAVRTKPGGIIVCCLPATETLQLPKTDFQVRANKTYGDAQLLFFERL